MDRDPEMNFHFVIDPTNKGVLAGNLPLGRALSQQDGNNRGRPGRWYRGFGVCPDEADSVEFVPAEKMPEPFFHSPTLPQTAGSFSDTSFLPASGNPVRVIGTTIVSSSNRPGSRPYL